MRRIAVINQKGGVGKTTTCANLGAALARLGRRVVVVDMDPQANLSLHLGQELYSEDPSSYTVLTGETPFEAAVRPTSTPGLSIAPAHIDLSGAELELASAIGRETLLRDAVDDWERAALARTGAPPADYLILDCPPSLGLLSVNALAAAREVLIAVQTEFFALQGMSKLVEVVQLLRRRLNPELHIRGILPCLYDSRLRLAREVLAEVRRYFPGQVFQTSIRTNVKLAEAPSHGVTIFEYDPQCTGATDHLALARELQAQDGGRTEEARAETAPERADELERRLSDMARGSHHGGTPDERPSEPNPEPEAVDEAEIRPVTFPTASAADSESAGVGVTVPPEPAEDSKPQMTVTGTEDEQPLAPEDAHLHGDVAGDPSTPVKATLEPISWRPHAPEPAATDSVAAVLEEESTQDPDPPVESPESPLQGVDEAPEATEDSPEALAEVDVPRPDDPPAPSRWNFNCGYGEDRPRMASKLGPRTT